MRYLVVLLLAGCSSGVWVQDGKTEQDRKRDLYACERDAAVVVDKGTKGMRRRCMESKGWTRQ